MNRTTEHRILISQWCIWCVWCVWMLLFAVWHPFDLPGNGLLGTEIATSAQRPAADENILFRVAAITLQCVSLQLISLLVVLGCYRWRSRFAVRIAPWLFALAPTWYAIDVVAYRWTGLHLVSFESWTILTEHLLRVTPFFSWGMLRPIGILLVALLAGGISARLAARAIGSRGDTNTSPRRTRYQHATVAMIVAGGFVIAIWMALVIQTSDRLQRSMREHPTRHPWAAFIPQPHPPREIPTFQYDAKQLAERTQTRIAQMRMNVALPIPEPPTSDRQTTQPPDVLIIVCESLRPEMLSPEVMPNAFRAASGGLILRKHYSGGNATSLGMFSIVSGMEAIWFYKSDVRFAPSLNRLFHQAGYELGFFAGHDDWGTFQMDAFLSPQQFERFEIEPMDWLESDRRAIAATESFLTRSHDSPRPPRLAILFLYSTHAPFAVEARHATDLPKATANYPIPFTPSWRGRVWNRYRNAARTLDDAIARLLRPDRVTILTGDHGEAFLDDGTVGHGTKLSSVQTRVAGFLSGPGIAARSISARTTHADLLPTLLAACNFSPSMPSQLDGLDLRSASTDQLQSRTISVSNLIGKDVVLLPPRSGKESIHPLVHSGAAIGIRVRFSLLDQTVSPLGPINEHGDLIHLDETTSRIRGDEVVHEWLETLAR
ncbi:sulfatase-like hydrolase/transferase [Rhodopirellula sallentina]|uniref:Sulfatase family protein n=1 Tax=Rhodopirellula sallentina SM41 TaxID=1263870 RepID=M5TZY3_9BACT|nr:sulfatase-like hydrolase/transferase [Rhodopirellula sallentina]EMI54750.1 sulfatase family protein [Rhodopirellula sallentina SM41]